jgi:hypothetical protein
MVAIGVSSAILYAPGAFFFYPWKSMMNALVGDSYEIAYKHFRRDHSDSANIAMHIVALVFQLLGNFGLLSSIDNILVKKSGFSSEIAQPFGGLLPAITAALWILSVLTAPAPPSCRVIAASAVTAGCIAAPLVSAHTVEIGCMTIFVAVAFTASLVFESLRLKRRRSLAEVVPAAVKAGVILGILVAIRIGVDRVWGGAWQSHTPEAVGGLVAVLVALAFLPHPIKPVVIFGAFACRVVSVLTQQEALLFFSAAFTAMVMQGQSHDITQETATLLHLDKMEDKVKKLRFEWAHVTFFPLLLAHAIRESLHGECGTAAD